MIYIYIYCIFSIYEFSYYIAKYAQAYTHHYICASSTTIYSDKNENHRNQPFTFTMSINSASMTYFFHQTTKYTSSTLSCTKDCRILHASRYKTWTITGYPRRKAELTSQWKKKKKKKKQDANFTKTNHLFLQL